MVRWLWNHEPDDHGRGGLTGWVHRLGRADPQLGAAPRLIDQVVVNAVPVLFRSGRPFLATDAVAEPLRFGNPCAITQGDQLTHLVYDVCR